MLFLHPLGPFPLDSSFLRFFCPFLFFSLGFPFFVLLPLITLSFYSSPLFRRLSVSFQFILLLLDSLFPLLSTVFFPVLLVNPQTISIFFFFSSSTPSFWIFLVFLSSPPTAALPFFLFSLLDQVLPFHRLFNSCICNFLTFWKDFLRLKGLAFDCSFSSGHFSRFVPLLLIASFFFP